MSFVLPVGNNGLVLLWPLCSYPLSQSGSYVLFWRKLYWMPCCALVLTKLSLCVVRILVLVWAAIMTFHILVCLETIKMCFSQLRRLEDLTVSAGSILMRVLVQAILTWCPLWQGHWPHLWCHYSWSKGLSPSTTTLGLGEQDLTFIHNNSLAHSPQRVVVFTCRIISLPSALQTYMPVLFSPVYF